MSKASGCATVKGGVVDELIDVFIESGQHPSTPALSIDVHSSDEVGDGCNNPRHCSQHLGSNAI